MWRAASKLVLLLLLVVTALAGISRASQPPMPALLYIQNRELYVVQTDCPSFLQTCAIHGRKLLDNLYSFPVASWSPDGAYIAVHLQNRWALYPANCLLENPDCAPAYLDPFINAVRPAWGPDSSVIAFVDPTAQNIILLSRGCWDGSPPSACFQQTTPLTPHPLTQQPDWSADGRYLLLSERQPPGFLIFDVACLSDPAGCAGYQHELLAQQFTGTSWPSFSPDSKTILYTADPSQNGTQESLFLMDTQTGQSRPLTHLGISFYPDWSADGRYIAFSRYQPPTSRDARLYLIDFTRGITQLFLHIPGQNLYFPSWGP